MNGLWSKILGVGSFFCPPPLNKWIHRWRGVDMKSPSTVWIGFGTIIDNAFPRNIHVGEDVTISAGVKIFAHFEPPKAMQEKYLPFEVKDVHIGDHVFIGAGAVIVPGVKISDWAVIGAGAVVTKEVPPYAVCAGNPARVIGDIREKKRDDVS